MFSIRQITLKAVGLATLILVSLLAVPVLGAVDDNELIYGGDAGGTFLIIDKATGSSSIIGETGLALTDLAATPKGAEVYGITENELYRIDKTTGEAVLVGQILETLTNGNAVNALCFSSGGILYAATLHGELLRINHATGAGKIVGYFGGTRISSGDIAFTSDDVLYAVIRGNEVSDKLAKIDLKTGAATIIGKIGFPLVFGLTVDARDRLYGAVNAPEPQLIRIDNKTGTGTLVGPITNAQGFYGLTSVFPDRPGNHLVNGKFSGWCYPLNDLCDALSQCRSPVDNVSNGFMAYSDLMQRYEYGQHFSHNIEINENYSVGDNVYAMSRGRIVKVRREENYGGSGYNAMLVEYNYYAKDGTAKPVYVLYGHVTDIKKAPDYAETSTERDVSIPVSRYEPVAQLNDPGMGVPPHLHLAVMPGRWDSERQLYTYPATWYKVYTKTQLKNGRKRPFDLWSNPNGTSDWVDADDFQDPNEQDKVFFDAVNPALP